jgi:hypothetical protein
MFGQKQCSRSVLHLSVFPNTTLTAAPCTLSLWQLFATVGASQAQKRPKAAKGYGYTIQSSELGSEASEKLQHAEVALAAFCKNAGASQPPEESCPRPWNPAPPTPRSELQMAPEELPAKKGPETAPLSLPNPPRVLFLP